MFLLFGANELGLELGQSRLVLFSLELCLLIVFIEGLVGKHLTFVLAVFVDFFFRVLLELFVFGKIQLLDVLLHFFQQNLYLLDCLAYCPFHPLSDHICKLFDCLHVLKVVFVEKVYHTDILVHDFLIRLSVDQNFIGLVDLVVGERLHHRSQLKQDPVLEFFHVAVEDFI